MAARRVNLNGVQVSAGLLSTLTGAVAASYLGVGGTLIGAAIGSLASTVGGEVYRHYLERTHDQLRGAIDVRRYRSARSTVVGQANPTVAQNRLGVTSRRQDDQDAVETQVLHVPRPGDAAHGAVTPPRTIGPNDPTETFAAVDGRPQTGPAAAPTSAAGAAAGSTAEVSAANDGAANGGAGSTAEVGAADGGVANGGAAERGAANGSDGKKRPRWLVLAAVAVGTFLIAVAVITVFELSVGKTLSATVRGQSGSGTTVGGVVGGRTAKPTPPVVKQTATPSATPTTPSPSSTASVVPSSIASVGATPSPATSVTPGGPNNLASTPAPS
jgi:hypothetical protein